MLCRIAFVLFFLMALVAGAAAQGNSPRVRILLDADWRFYRGDIPGADFAPSGTPIVHWRWIADDGGESDAVRMADPNLDDTIPGWHDSTTGEDTFKGRVGFSWYRATLPEVRGPLPTLHFEGVDDNATVYLNGVLLATHQGWSDSFDVDMHPAWRPAGANKLAVLVENTNGPGGITAPVNLVPAGSTVAQGPARAEFDDHAWRTVHLPHDYIVEGTFSPDADQNHGYLPAAVGWYRKTFNLPASDRGKSAWIDFDGVYRDSRVWLNGHFLGRHASGYTSFRYDISAAANYGGSNVLSVYVDPRHFEGWWYEGGGIYRHVWLNIANPIHVAPWGTRVTATLPDADKPPPNGLPATAAISIDTSIANDSADGGSFILASQIFDSHSRAVVSLYNPAAIRPGEVGTVTLKCNLDHPRLWSPGDPAMYRLVTSLIRNGRVMDRTETPFGVRKVQFDAKLGLLLNYRPFKIYGTCNHQDFAGIGIAVPDSMEFWRVKKLKEMGANAWRMSHNPPTPELLDACDRLGMLVMDENRRLGSSPEILDQVASMVQRDRNHPSVILWSMCNEEPSAGTPAGGKNFAAMKATVLKYDQSRPVTCAMNQGWFGEGIAGVEDLMGVNYSYEVYDKFHALHPDEPIFGSETASTVTTRGEYADDKVHTYVSSYNMTDGSWQPAGSRLFVAGTFVWTGFDYKGEPSPYAWPDVTSNFGILDICGFPKDNYYYYQAWWKPESPVLHLMPHWNWPGRDGQEVKVIAFSNAARVELFLNGASLGVKDMPLNGHLEWMVKYAPGVLSAKGYDPTGKVAAMDQVATAGPPASLRLKSDRLRLTADAEDITVVEVDVLDAEGRIVPTANDRVDFTVDGVGYVAGVGNGNASDHDPDKASFRHAFNGRCMVLIGAKDHPGPIHLSATAPGLRGATMDFIAGRG